MAIIISGTTGIDMGNNSVSNASQIDGVVINENGDNVATTSNIVGFKNYIINGNFNIWQRGTSFNTVGYCADRWYLAIGGSTAAAKHSMSTNTIVVETTAASSYANLYQAIETATVVGLRGKTLTLSLKLVIGGTHTGGFSLVARYSNSTDTLFSQTTTIQALGISASSVNTRYSLTFTVPTDAVGLRIDLENTSVQPSGALYQVQEVQLEEGSVATPFEQRPIGLELSLCQRYYRKSFNINVTPSNAGSADSINDISNAITAFAPHRGKLVSGINTCSIPFGVEMRIAPTIQRYGNSSGYWFYNDGITAEFTHNMFVQATTKGLVIDNEISTAFNVLAVGHYTADAEL